MILSSPNETENKGSPILHYAFINEETGYNYLVFPFFFLFFFIKKIEQAVHFPLGQIICLVYPLEKDSTCPNVHQQTIKA